MLNKKWLLIIIPIAVICVAVAALIDNATSISTQRLTYQYSDITIMQTCQHTVVKLQNGKEVGVQSGILVITGNVQISLSSLFPKMVIVWPFLLRNGDEQKTCMISKVNPLTGESKKITSPDGHIREMLFLGLTKKHFSFSCTSDEKPTPGMFMCFLVMGDPYVVIPARVEPLSVALLSKPLIQEGATQVSGNTYDVVEFKVAITNNSNATWTFDYGEVIKAVDDDGSRYALMKLEPGCPQITIAPGERQELTLQFITRNTGTNPHLEYFTPLSTTPLPSR